METNAYQADMDSVVASFVTLAGAPWFVEVSEVSKNSNFWTAFYTGLAAPVALYATPTPYHIAYIPTTAQVFSYIGGCLSETIPTTTDDGTTDADGADKAA